MMKVFDSFQTLFTMSDENVRHLKKTERFIQTEAQKWFQQFGAKYGGHSVAGTPPGLYFYYNPTNLIFELPGLEGGIYFAQLIKTYHFAHWETPAFVLGMDEYKPTNGQRMTDPNPFPAADFYSRTAWQCGHTLALHGFTIETFLALFKTV